MPTAAPSSELPASSASGQRLSGSGYEGGTYDQAERAYVLARKAAAGKLTFTLAASPESPVSNFALIIKGWGDAGARLEIDGRPIASGKAFRTGDRQTLEGSDLIVWVEAASAKPGRSGWRRSKLRAGRLPLQFRP
jgi:hypothetical protein